MPWDDDQTAAYSAPKWEAEERTPYLFVLSSSRSMLIGKAFKLTKTENLLGRASDADVALDDQGVSRRHAKLITLGPAEFAIIDLESKNGTFLNGERVQGRAVLKEGDKIQVGETVVLHFTLQDAAEEQFHQNLYESATRDALTGAANKKHFMDTLRMEFAFATRHGTSLAILMMDVDHFKRVNDTHGHLAGDKVLSQVANGISRSLRTEDVLGRYGGEEFTVLLRQTAIEGARICAERCRRAVETLRTPLHDQLLTATISVGVAVLGQLDDNPEELVVRADRALYRAKQGGRNRVECDS